MREGHEFKIDLEDEVRPVHRALYKMNLLELEEAKKQIESMLEHGFIRPSDSPYGAAVLFVSKKDGSLRFCIDYLLAEQENGQEQLSTSHYQRNCSTGWGAPRCSVRLIFGQGIGRCR